MSSSRKIQYWKIQKKTKTENTNIQNTNNTKIIYKNTNTEKYKNTQDTGQPVLNAECVNSKLLKCKKQIHSTKNPHVFSPALPLEL